MITLLLACFLALVSALAITNPENGVSVPFDNPLKVIIDTQNYRFTNFTVKFNTTVVYGPVESVNGIITFSAKPILYGLPMKITAEGTNSYQNTVMAMITVDPYPRQELQAPASQQGISINNIWN